MKNILENHLARKLILIELLYNKKKYIQIDDAIEILDCSKNTLLKDILEINNYFYIIEFEKNKGFF
ncbi:helix-turn-helix domain-containing protein [Brochothrix thermosphacta]|uniref:helix-turn-helix domain-containing protein n=1 Tax=Brochothrix thermosphacta TaxID=2756 RepID=UPI003458C7B6